MKVVWTAIALADLEDALEYTRRHFPRSVVPFEQRVRAVVERVSRWPESARTVQVRPGVRVVPLTRYPYRLFYRVSADQIEVLHFHHSARDLWDE